MNKNRKAALALAAWLAILPGLTVAEGYTEGTAAVDQPEAQNDAANDSQPEEETEETVEEIIDEPTEEKETEGEETPDESETELLIEDDSEQKDEPDQKDESDQKDGTEQKDGTTPTETQDPVQEGAQEPEADDWKPQGNAWTELESGEHTAGALGDVLSWLEQHLAEDEEATVYIRTRDVLTADNVSRNLLSRVGFEPDGESDSFNTEKYEYVAVLDSKDLMTLEETGDMEDVRLSISVQMLREDELDKIDSNETQPPETNETQPPETGETQTPGTGGTQTPGTGETQNPGTGETQNPSEPAPVPKPVLEVTAEDYEPGVWKNSPPMFTLSGIPEDSTEYVYGVFICDERLILLSNGNNMYVPSEEGLSSVRFVILDKMGDVQSLSDQYDTMLDFTPPDGPYLSGDKKNKKVCYVEAYDDLSGLDSISYDGGKTWLSCNDPETDNMTFYGEVGETVDAGWILTRDFAGNISSNDEEFIFGKKKRTGTGSGTGTGKKPIRHVKETMDYSKANYNALELNVSDQPQTELTIGGTALSLSLTEEEQLKPFAAELTTWQTKAGETKTAPNALVLTAATDAQANVWHFGGETYKLLYNSGVEYLVFASGEYITVIPTDGFTGGTQYGKLKAGGVSTRKFEYTLIQDETLRETTLSVQVEGETYLLEESTENPMYRYNVLIGTKDMMKKPYESYQPGKEAT